MNYRSLAWLLLLPCLARAAPEVTLASLEWPPYSGQALPEQGSAAAIARAAFLAMGYQLNIRFLPWSRAVALARGSPQVMGYFPEYDSEQGRRAFVFSQPIGVSPLGFAERSDHRLNWRHLSDLSRLRIGVVQDYVNTAELDARIASKQQAADAALDDAKNLLKLHRGYVDLAVIDSNVFHYLMQHDKALQPLQGQLLMNPRLLENKLLFVCFKSSPEGQRLAAIFNQGLKRLSLPALPADAR